MAVTRDLALAKRPHTLEHTTPSAIAMPPPPISLLNDDVLSLIFTINTHAIEDSTFLDASDLAATERHHFPPALDNTRAASQVCTQWRTVVLGSSSMWANAVNVNLLDQRTSSWRDEVLKRTGNAPLTVVSPSLWRHRLKAGPIMRRWLIEVLTNQWERIARLVIIVEELEVATCLHSVTQHHSPNLSLLAICRNGPFSPVLDSTQVPRLLGATNLHFFRFDGLEIQRAHQPWSTTLVGLDLWGARSVTNLLNILRGIPQLQTLHLDQQPMEGLTAPVPVVPMPYLRKVCLSQSGSPTVLGEILSHLDPASGCSVKIETVIKYGDRPHAHSFLGTYLEFMQRCNSLSKVSHLDLGVVKLDVWLPGALPINRVMYARFRGQDTTYMDFRSDQHSDTFLRYIDPTPDILMKTIADLDLRGVRSLTFHLPNDVRGFEPSNADIHYLLARLTSATELQADSSTLSFLDLAQRKAQEFLLPNLSIIKLCLDDFSIKELRIFVSARASRGRWITEMFIPSEAQKNGALMSFLKIRKDFSDVWVEEDYRYPVGEKRLKFNPFH